MCAFIASVNLTQLLFLVMLVTAIMRILIHDLAVSRGEMRHSVFSEDRPKANMPK